MKQQTKLFRAGSKTYFNATRFFPAAIRCDVVILYGFVRKADNFVDAVPQQADAFYAYRDSFRTALDGRVAGDPVIDDFVDLMKRCSVERDWIEAFFASMEMDLVKSVHRTLDESLLYTYGSAEVIGLCMARIMELDESSYYSARMLGRAMQYINFIRDIDEDNGFGRIYLPIAESRMNTLTCEEAHANPDEFIRFIHAQLDRYDQWHRYAAEGYRFIPRRLQIPVKTAMDMYHWTATVIRRDPFIVFQKKVKPRKIRILLRATRNATCLPRKPKEQSHHV